MNGWTAFGTGPRAEALGTLLLRLGLGWFLLVWAVNKILLPDQYARIWHFAHGVDISVVLAQAMGWIQVVLALAIMLGLFRTASYAIGFAIHLVTVIVIHDALLHPFAAENGFPVNRNQSIALAALGGFASLWLLRRRDRWSFDVWWARRRG